MQKISIPNLKPGMLIEKNVFDSNGTLLLRSGTVINDKIINRLAMYNLNSVYIKSPLREMGGEFLDNIDKEMPDLIQEETRLKAAETMRSSFSSLCSSVNVDTDKISQIAELLLEEVLKNGAVMIHLTDIRTYDDQTFVHSVNVAAMSAVLGIKMGYNQKQLYELAIGAILHDVGKLLLPPAILTKKSQLNEAEFELVKEHPVTGFEILRKNKNISLLSSHVAFQHHEKFDGTGYTRGIKGKDIHEYARIVALTDVYEALTSDRYYRKGYMPHEAYEMMLAMSGTYFDQEILQLFLKQLVVYPLGTVVMLNSGMLAMVEKITPGLQLRPVVKVIAETESIFLMDKSFSIDLAKDLKTTIERVLPEDEVCKLIQAYQKRMPS